MARNANEVLALKVSSLEQHRLLVDESVLRYTGLD